MDGRKAELKSPGAKFGEKERTALYNAGTVRTLAKGESLLKRDQRVHEICMVLGGSLGIIGRNGKIRKPAFSQGDLIHEQALFDSDSSILAIAAEEPSRVLVLSKSEFNALGPATQSALLMQIICSSNSKILRLRDALASAGLRRNAITSRLVGNYGTSKKKYEESELIQNLLKKIPRLPIYVTQLIELLVSENASAKSVTELAKKDPSLVGEVLKEVNSAHYGVRQEVSDLYYAIMLMGFNQVYQILVSQGVRKTMPDSEQSREIHHHSIMLSHLAFEVCHLCDRHNSSLLSTIGLLHDIGKSTVLLIEKENPRLAFFVQMLDPNKIGAMLLKKWNIPTVICETVEYQSFPAFALPSEIPSQFRKQIAILHLSHAIYDADQENSVSALDYPFLEDHMALCNIEGKSFSEVADLTVKNLRLKAHLLPPEVKKFLVTRP